MIHFNSKLQSYFKTGQYKGFYPSDMTEYNSVLGQRWLVRFTNGQEKLVAVGRFRKQTLLKMFDIVDRFRDQARRRYFKYISGLEDQ